MLNENDVVNTVCAHLEGKGYQILKRCSTTDRGIDIIAKHPSNTGKLLVEAKGGTSALKGSARYDKGFSRSQVFDRVAKCVYTAASMHTDRSSDDDKVAMAFPDTLVFRHYLRQINAVTKKLDFLVFLVRDDHSVEEL